tara:strand:+ start:17009 stop:17176 length:168 start_codon:yes stop_codon:yes gene_type:complete
MILRNRGSLKSIENQLKRKVVSIDNLLKNHFLFWFFKAFLELFYEINNSYQNDHF